MFQADKTPFRQKALGRSEDNVLGTERKLRDSEEKLRFIKFAKVVELQCLYLYTDEIYNPRPVAHSVRLCRGPGNNAGANQDGKPG